MPSLLPRGLVSCKGLHTQVQGSPQQGANNIRTERDMSGLGFGAYSVGPRGLVWLSEPAYKGLPWDEYGVKKG